MSAVVYKGFTKEEMEFHFNPQATVPNQKWWTEERKKASLKARATLKSRLDVPYGTSTRQVMDIFSPRKREAPVLLYFHGGYWRGGSKEENCHLAELFVKAGAAVAVVEYDLCPHVTVADIVRQARDPHAADAEGGIGRGVAADNVLRAVVEFGREPLGVFVARAWAELVLRQTEGAGRALFKKCEGGPVAGCLRTRTG